MDLGGLGGVKAQYKAVKTVKKVNDFTIATRKKAKSIGSASFEGEDTRDDLTSDRGSTKRRAKSKPDNDGS